MFTQLALEFNRNPQLDDDEGFEQVPTAKCPFDGSHIMQPKNLITHINRCKSPNKHLYVECRYDPCHWVYMEQLQHHYLDCPTRKQYYADLDLKDGDWDQQQSILKLQQKALREKMDKKKRKILKLMIIVKLRKKLKRASTKQQFENIKALLIKEQSCFASKSDKKSYNQFQLFKVKSTAKYQPKSFENQGHISEKTQNISNIRPYPQINSSFYQGQTINNYNLHYVPFLGQNHIQPTAFYQPFRQTALHQPQYFSFIQQQPFYPEQQLTSQIFMQPKMLQCQQFYYYSDTNYPPRMRKKPQPERGLMFSQTANTEDFIKKTHNKKYTNQEKKNYSNYQKYQQHSITNNQFQFEQFYQNNGVNQIYQSNLYPSYQSHTPFIKNFVNYPTKFPQRHSKNGNSKDDNKNKKQKQVPHRNYSYVQEDQEEHSKRSKPNKQKKQQDKKRKKKSNKQDSKKQDKKLKQPSQKNVKGTRKKAEMRYEFRTLENLESDLDVPESKKILNFEITQYDFIPFDLHQDLTIKKQSSYQIEDAEEKSSFLEMKEMLQILQDNSKG